MKIYTVMIFIISFLLIGCEIDNSNKSQAIDIIGTWNYKVKTQYSICDGLISEGVKIVVPLNINHNSKVKEIIIQGTTFDMDNNGNCELIPINTINGGYGESSIKTIDDWKIIILNGYDKNEIIESEISEFNKQKIVSYLKFKNGVILTDTMTRY